MFTIRKILLRNIYETYDMQKVKLCISYLGFHVLSFTVVTAYYNVPEYGEHLYSVISSLIPAVFPVVSICFVNL